jgi:hypothetical protein
MTTKQLAALLGFAFVAAWIGFGFGYAILCLLGAAVFYVAAGVREGEIDLAELQGRLGAQRNPASPVDRPASTVPRPRARHRVQ